MADIRLPERRLDSGWSTSISLTLGEKSPGDRRTPAPSPDVTMRSGSKKIGE
jgi:hypothetical protein